MTNAKKLMSKRVLLLVVAVALALASIASFTHAWFTSSAQTGARTVEMGRLKVEGNFAAEEDSAIYEPGLEIAKEGDLKNTGSIASFVRVSIDPTVVKYSDANGNPTTPGAPITNDPNVISEFDPEKLGYQISGVDGADSFFWYKDGAGNYYVLMDGAANPKVKLNISFNGPGMGNDYQGARIYFGSQWKVTQALPAAINDEFGVDIDSLEFIANDLGAGRRMAFGASAEEAEAIAREILARG